MWSERHCLIAQNGHQYQLNIYVCNSKTEVQEVILEKIGYLPGDYTDGFWLDENVANIVIRSDSSLGRIAHEALHAAVAIMSTLNLNPNEYNLIKPNGDDFGYIPAEMCADLCEQITNKTVLAQKNQYSRVEYREACGQP